MLRTVLVALVSVLLFAACGSSEDLASGPPASSISSTEAARHVGERATVCGPVVDSRYATGSNGRPTFLNFDKPYPNHTFVVVIWGGDRGKFPASPESHFKNKQVCVTGLIESYQGDPEIIARAASQRYQGKPEIIARVASQLQVMR